MSTSLPNAALSRFAGIDLETAPRGAGRPILYLHGIDGPLAAQKSIALLERHGTVVAPAHPGFGSAPAPEWIRSVDDLAYLYLDLIEQLDWHDVAVVGHSMGAWIAAEMATKNCTRFGKLVLVDPMGLRVGGREVRDFPDIFALHPDDVYRLTMYDAKNPPDFTSMPDAEVTAVAKAREACALYLWEPYMHNPQLGRRLHRIAVPTLILRGEADRIVSDAYARSFAASIAGARYELVERAGHLPQVENPEALVRSIVRFIES